MKKVLILEDDGELGRNWCDALAAGGLRARHVYSLEEAESVLRCERFDVAILDVYVSTDTEALSPEGGLLLLSQSFPGDSIPTMRTLVVTGVDLQGFSPLELAKRLGADDVAEKPLRGADILRRIQQFQSEAGA